MKLTTRGSVAAAWACVTAAVGAAPAVAGTSVPVTVPLASLETVAPIEAPAPGTGVPVPVPGAPAAPAHVAGQLLPHGALPQVPFTGELPGTAVEVPVERPLGEGALTAGVTSDATDLVFATPGASLGAPLSAPRPELFGQPEPVLPEVALLTPTLRGAPAARVLLG
ncbi:hypothetical protein [Streptomyces sp. NPDC048057]|uniref:hypothetical protein n=1 Tax=Streptomyces sp. NPDC048057 TaxID=3155628 RepID=UPI0033F698E0